jgi:hypothetical protein
LPNQAQQEPCATLLTGGPVVDAIWLRLLERAGPRPGLPLTDEPDLHLLIDDQRVDGAAREDGTLVFRLPQIPPPHASSRAPACRRNSASRATIGCWALRCLASVRTRQQSSPDQRRCRVAQVAVRRLGQPVPTGDHGGLHDALPAVRPPTRQHRDNR